MAPLHAPFTERATWYNLDYAKWPASHFLVTKRWASATWVLGNNYRGSGYYGAYPPGYLPRVHSLFRDIPATQVLHLFSGSIQYDPWGGGQTLDINPATGAKLIADATRLNECVDLHKRFRLVLADPPYTATDAERYGTSLPSRSKVLAMVRHVVPVGGHVVWMDTSLPMYSKKVWMHVGHISIVRSTNHRYRGVAIFQRMPESTS